MNRQLLALGITVSCAGFILAILIGVSLASSPPSPPTLVRDPRPTQEATHAGRGSSDEATPPLPSSRSEPDPALADSELRDPTLAMCEIQLEKLETEHGQIATILGYKKRRIEEIAASRGIQQLSEDERRSIRSGLAPFEEGLDRALVERSRTKWSGIKRKILAGDFRLYSASDGDAFEQERRRAEAAHGFANAAGLNVLVTSVGGPTSGTHRVMSFVRGDGTNVVESWRATSKAHAARNAAAERLIVELLETREHR